MNNDKQELVLEIGAAGGILSVWSVLANDGSRSFLVKRDESALMDFVDEEDASSFTYCSETGHLRSFTDALTVLGRYPWHRLYPLFVHQDFSDPVLKAVVRRGGEEEAERWQCKLETSKNRSPNFNQTDT